jgi:hypothetical protein
MTDTNKITIVATGGQQGTVTAEAAMKTAWGYHYAAGELEALHQQQIGTVPRGISLDQDILDRLVGRAAGAVVLEALALEIALKARLLRSGISFAALRDKHDHSALYALVPDVEKPEAEQRYQSARHPAMRSTLAEALSFSAQVFKQWRYMHEHSSVQSSMGEMQRAFAALTHGT